MLRLVPPAGAPVKTGQIVRALGTALAGGAGEESMARLATRLGVRQVWGVSSGRAALWVVFRSLQRLRPGRNVVALPAYTCFSVAASIVRAGLKLYPLDMDPQTLDFDRSQLETLPSEKLLCILTSNLFGYVNDMATVREAARKTGAFVVDNAAQALGAYRDGQCAGTSGDVGVYSLGRGKALSAMEGGLIVANTQAISRALEQEARNLQPAAPAHGAYLLFQLTAYSAFLRPSLYWIPDALPFLKLGTTEFDPQFAVHTLHPLSRELLLILLERLDTMNEIRRENAGRLIEALAGSRDFRVPQPSPETRPTMVRLPVIARDEETRTRAVDALRREGIGASAFYPRAICDIDNIGAHMPGPAVHCEKAERLARTLFTVPVHPLVGHRDTERMIGVLTAM
jgi:perosamine synthetase